MAKSKNSGNRTSLIVLALAFVMTSIVFGLYFIKNSQLINKAAEQSETANWKTYINTKYGYKLRYPNDWRSPPSDQIEALFAPRNAEGAPIGLSVTKSSLSDQITKRETELESAGYITKLENYIANNAAGKKLIFNKDERQGFDFFAEKDGNVYHFIGASGQFVNTASQILSTFKFLD